MQHDTITVGMAEIKVAKAPNQLTCLGLGSCVGVCAYYAPLKLGGIAHIMLPASSMVRDESAANPAKFADTAIPLLIDEIERQGGEREKLVIKIAGGAQMFATSCPDERLSVGLKNIAAVESVCDKMGYKIVARLVGGNTGKSVILDLNNGVLQVRTLSESVFI
jgi:chemotaxis protein CheD